MFSAVIGGSRCRQLVVIVSVLASVSALTLYTVFVMRVPEYGHLYAENKDTPAAEETAETNDLKAKHPEVSVATSAADSRSGVKKILFWNSWYHRKYYDFGVGEEPFKKYNCPEQRCSTTGNREQLETADAVVICGRLLDWQAEHVIPARRDPDQVYVYFNREAPVTQLGHTHRLNGVFNVTMTYRRDSTIPWPYSVIERRSAGAGYIPITTDDIRRKSRDRPISWMVSRCHKKGCVRHEYAKHLARYIPIDVYGRCGNLSCPRDHSDTCMIMQERKYKFYLAFENAVCRDYVTEKAFRTLNYSIVPVVMGGAHYADILPPHSFIDVRDFASPQQLASYLHYLNNNDTAYLEYFAWKNHYRVRTVQPYEPFCRLCQLLHEPGPFLVNFDLERWWDGMAGETCVRDDYRPKLMEYFHVDPDIEPMPRTHGKLRHEGLMGTTDRTTDQYR